MSGCALAGAAAGAGARTRGGGVLIRSLGSMTGVNAAKALGSIGVSFAVARTVGPAHFGLVAFAIPLLSLVTLLTDLGIASAVVREPSLDRRQAGAAVSLMGVAGLLGGLVLLAASAPLGAAVAMPGLASVLALYGGVAALSVWAAVPRALLERRFRYGPIGVVELLALALALLAFAGTVGRTGVLCFVIYQLVLQLARAMAFLVLARPLFAFNADWACVRSLTRVGLWVLATNLLSYAARNLDNLLVGAILGAASLGLYGLAYQIMTIPLVLLTWPASGVLLSTLARLRGTGLANQADVATALLAATACVSFPAMTLLAVGAHEPLAWLYGHRWHGLDRVVAILAPVGALQSIASYSGAVLVANGAVRANLAIGLVNGVVLSVLFLVAVPFGLHTLVVAYAIAAALLSAVQIAVIGRALGIGAAGVARALAPGALASLAAAAAFAAIRGAGPSGMAGWLLAALAFGLAAASSFALMRRTLLVAIRRLTGVAHHLAPGHTG